MIRDMHCPVLLVFLLGCSLLALPAFSESSGNRAGDSNTKSFGSGIGSEEAPPNIIFIMLDDLDYFDLPAYGNTQMVTPEIDQVVSEGMLLTNYYANGPLCPLTRNALMTGNYQSRHGIKRLPKTTTKGIPESSLVLPQILQSYGYATAHVGKWHLGREHEEYLPFAKGYDTFLVGKDYIGRVQPDYGDPEFILDGQQFFPNKHATEALTDFTVSFIEQNQADPFFINLWYFTPHKPLECPPDFDVECAGTIGSNPNLNVYQAMVSNADQQIGRVFDKITELGLEQNTLIIVTSDNGGFDDDTHAALPPGEVLRGAKTDVFERGIKVPFIAWGPGLVPAGTVNDSIVVGFDMLQTFEQLARPEGIHWRMEFDGTSAIDILTSDPVLYVERQGTLFWEHNFKDDDDYDSDTGWFQNFAVRSGNWKLIMDENKHWSAAKLFDLSTNPGEDDGGDLKLAYPLVYDTLMAEYWGWRKETGTVPHYVESSSGSVTSTTTDNASTFQFTGGGGTAEINQTKLFDYGEGDFSVSLKARFDQGGTSPVVVGKPASWVLSLTANNKLKLRLTGVPPAPGDPIPTAVITSNSPLVIGQDYDLAFTITGFASGPGTVRMYVDGVLQTADSDTLMSIAIVEEAVRVGNNYNSPPDRPFIGEIEDLTFYLNSLTQEEIDALVQ